LKEENITMCENHKRKLIVAITGASGAIYGIRLLEILKQHPYIESHLIISKAAYLTISHETDCSIEQVKELADYYYNISDVGARISSGSFRTSGMIIAPCSMKTLGTIANSIEDNLISRTAGVCLKERKNLVLMIRESPLHAGHLGNMLKIAQLGGIIAPPVPAFYNLPKTIDDIVNHSVSRALSLFDIDSGLVKSWDGMH
jgi:4-hydroxy-3-polyprenylbenzoate decarboxylase